MTDAEIIAAIRKNHLNANIGYFEDEPRQSVIHWERATVDAGGTIFGDGPYLKVPVSGDGAEIVIRVYPPERLRRKLERMMPT